ncbi:hypothetical protein CQA77_30450, partial [Klebsiella pneumoniae]
PALLHVDPFPPIIDEDLQPGEANDWVRNICWWFCPHPALLHVDPFPPIIDEDLQPGEANDWVRNICWW